MLSTSEDLKRIKIKVRWYFFMIIFVFQAVSPEILSIENILATINSEIVSENNKHLKIVGVLTQPLSPRLVKHFEENISQNRVKPSNQNIKSMTYIAASYVSWIKKRNVMVVPINPGMERTVLDKILMQLSGLLIPGGKTTILLHDTVTESGPGHFTSMRSTKKSDYAINALYIIDFLKERQKKQKIKIPIFGTCLGFELLILDFGFPEVKFRIVENFKHLSPLRLTDKQTDFSPDLIPRIEKNSIFYFNHRYGLTVQEFSSCQKISSSFDLLAVADTTFNEEKVSTDSGIEHSSYPIVVVVKAKDYPFIGVQFHPEKNEFETNLELPRQKDEIEVMDQFSERFAADLQFIPEQEDTKIIASFYKDIEALEVGSYKGFKKVYTFANDPILSKTKLI